MQSLRSAARSARSHCSCSEPAAQLALPADFRSQPGGALGVDRHDVPLRAAHRHVEAVPALLRIARVLSLGRQLVVEVGEVARRRGIRVDPFRRVARCMPGAVLVVAGNWLRLLLDPSLAPRALVRDLEAESAPSSYWRSPRARTCSGLIGPTRFEVCFWWHSPGAGESVPLPPLYLSLPWLHAMSPTATSTGSAACAGAAAATHSKREQRYESAHRKHGSAR